MSTPQNRSKNSMGTVGFHEIKALSIYAEPLICAAIFDTPLARSLSEQLMSKSKIQDGMADAIAATGIISIALVTMIVWLSGFPS